MKQGIMGASYFCMLGFPQPWFTKTSTVVMRPRAGMQLLRKLQARGISLFLQWERNEGELNGLGGARQTGREPRQNPLLLASVSQMDRDQVEWSKETLMEE